MMQQRRGYEERRPSFGCSFHGRCDDIIMN